MKRGTWYAVAAYAIWGLFPAYWKLLHQVPALQTISHRIVWSMLILLSAIVVSRQWASFRLASVRPSVIGVYFIAALLIASNWLVYIWAVNAGFVIETSLGYFINPLFSVLLGVIFLRERLRPLQWLPVGVAAIGVIYLTVQHGSLPWIALVLSVTFGLYGLVKKKASLGSLYGLMIETGLLAFPALLYLIYCDANTRGAFLHVSGFVDMLLVGAGLVTTMPLLLFASAAQRIPLSLAGILQYIAPTLQFLLGLLVYKEVFTQQQLIGFSIIWAALIIFALDGWLAFRNLKLGGASL